MATIKDFKKAGYKVEAIYSFDTIYSVFIKINEFVEMEAQLNALTDDEVENAEIYAFDIRIKDKGKVPFKWNLYPQDFEKIEGFTNDLIELYKKYDLWEEE